MASVLSLPQKEKARVQASPAAAVPAEPPATLWSDHVAFALWLACAALIAALMVKDYVRALLPG